jgi:hypothetical protein
LDRFLNKIQQTIQVESLPQMSNVSEFKITQDLHFYLQKVEENYLSYLFYYYYGFQKVLPIRTQIFLCSRSTSKDSLENFLYRFLCCPLKSLFCLMKIELLTTNLQKFFINVINSFISKKKINSYLIILYEEKNFKMPYIIEEISKENIYFPFISQIMRIPDNKFQSLFQNNTNLLNAEIECPLDDSKKRLKISKTTLNYKISQNFSKEFIIDYLSKIN